MINVLVVINCNANKFRTHSRGFNWGLPNNFIPKSKNSVIKGSNGHMIIISNYQILASINSTLIGVGSIGGTQKSIREFGESLIRENNLNSNTVYGSLLASCFSLGDSVGSV